MVNPGVSRSGNYRSMRDVHESFNNQENVSEKISPKQSISTDYVAWTIVVLSIALFVPLMVGADFHLQGSEEEINARSVECRSFAIASLSICISLLIDLLLDISFTENAGYLYLRAYSLFNLAAYSLIYIVASNYSNFGQISVVIGAVQVFGEVSSIVWLLRSLDVLGCWSIFAAISVIVLYFMNFVFWFLNFIYYHGNTKSTFSTLSSFFFYFALVLFIGHFAYWFYLLYKEIQINKKEKTNLSIEIYYSNVIIAVTVVFTILKELLVPVIHDITGMTDDYAISSSTYFADGNFLLRTGLTFFLCLLPGRIFKRRAAERNYDSEMKSTFVSFMNHEMRTPLNIVRTFITIYRLISYSPNDRHRAIFARQADSEQVQHRDSA